MYRGAGGGSVRVNTPQRNPAVSVPARSLWSPALCRGAQQEKPGCPFKTKFLNAGMECARSEKGAEISVPQGGIPIRLRAAGRGVSKQLMPFSPLLRPRLQAWLTSTSAKKRWRSLGSLPPPPSSIYLQPNLRAHLPASLLSGAAYHEVALRRVHKTFFCLRKMTLTFFFFYWSWWKWE